MCVCLGEADGEGEGGGGWVKNKMIAYAENEENTPE